MSNLLETQLNLTMLACNAAQQLDLRGRVVVLCCTQIFENFPSCRKPSADQVPVWQVNGPSGGPFAGEKIFAAQVNGPAPTGVAYGDLRGKVKVAKNDQVPPWQVNGDWQWAFAANLGKKIFACKVNGKSPIDLPQRPSMGFV